VHERLGREATALGQREATGAQRLGDVRVTMATLAWFLAEARTIDGPPMSICSTHSSSLAPDATVSRKG
jgi:hypothetical protein